MISTFHGIFIDLLLLVTTDAASQLEDYAHAFAKILPFNGIKCINQFAKPYNYR